MSVSAANAWAVYQFFNGTFDNVHAACWEDPPPSQDPPAQSAPAPAPAPVIAAAEDTKKEVAEKEEDAVKEAEKPKIVIVELQCLMCCKGCKKSVKKALNEHSAFTSYKVDRKLMKVTVNGENLKPEDVLKIVQKASKKTTDFWPKPPEKEDKEEKKEGKEEKKEDKEEKKEDKEGKKEEKEAEEPKGDAK